LRAWRTFWTRREASDIDAAKLTSARIHQHYLDWGFRSHRINAGQKHRLVNIRVTQANRARLTSHPVIADVDVVITCGQIDASAGT